jgi:hypothetical protein
MKDWKNKFRNKCVGKVDGESFAFVPLTEEFISNLLQHQREEMKKEILKIGEHFVKFGEKKGVEAIDMVLAVINPQQNGESKK